MRSFILVALLVGCGPTSRGDDTTGDGAGPECGVGEHRCNGPSQQVCMDGHWITQQDCAKTCDEQLGCVDCAPGSTTCGDDGNVHSCDTTGHDGGVTAMCTGVALHEKPLGQLLFGGSHRPATPELSAFAHT